MLGSRSFGAGLALMVAGRIGSMMALLAFNALAARALEPASMGVYVLHFSMALALAFPISLGFGEAAVRRLPAYAKQPSKEQSLALLQLMARILMLWLPCAFGGVCILYGIAASATLVPPTTAVATVLLALWSTTLAGRLVVVGLCRGLGEVRLASFLDGLAVHLGALAAFALLMVAGLQASSQLAVGAHVAAGACACWYGFGKVRSTLGLVARGQRLEAHRTSAAELLTLSVPLMMPGLLANLTAQSLLLIIGSVGSLHEVALFGLAQQLTNVIALLFIMSHLLGSAAIVRLHQADQRAELQALTRALATFSALLAWPAAICLLFFGEWLITQLFGPQYAEGAPVVAALAVGKSIEITIGPAHTVLMMTGKERLYAMLQLVALPIRLVAAWLAYTAGGVATVAVVAAAFGVGEACIVALLARRYIGVNTVATLRVGRAIRTLRDFSMLEK